MSTTSASKFAASLGDGARALLSGRLLERLRHVVWAAVVAATLFMVLLLEPVDQFLWLVQSKMADRDPSGDIVFVSSDQVLSDPQIPHRRIELAQALDELDRRGVGKVFLDITFAKSKDATADARLAKAIADLGPRITIVDRIIATANNGRALRTTSAKIGGGADRVVSDETDRNFFGLAWELQPDYRVNGKQVTSLAAALGGARKFKGERFPIDYGFSQRKLPVTPFGDLQRTDNPHTEIQLDLSGKTVVIGHSQKVDGAMQAIPSRSDAPASYVDIYAGETLRAGLTSYFRGSATIALFAILLVIVLASASSRKRRWVGYAIVISFAPAIFVLGAKAGIRVDLSYALAFLGIYAGLRSRTRWKRRVEMVNQETGLPKLRALEQRLLRENIGSGHLVVAKIQNYERVLKTLRAEDKGSYVLKLVDRLRATDPNLAIYSDGHHLGWHTPGDEADAVCDHLEGLRAIFAAPVRVGGYSVDVGITFGVASVEGDPAARLAAAVAAAEETSESHNPIVVAETGSQTDLLWDISLRARIDEAMEAGEIYCVYQPKFDLASKTMAGVEALVRWHDPARGFISPMHFIQQCEKAGRMEHLTRYVLQTACSAGQLLHFRGRRVTMAVNISATLLSDMRIVGTVRNVLQATRFDPRALVLEITETARISDFSVAASILEELREIGVKISMDDFGVGMANFEAFYELPFDELKIDRQFVSHIATDDKARAIVASIAAMGRKARITVVAEGLENPQDIRLLEEIGCQQVQGYAFSRPISLSNLLEYKDSVQDRPAANMV